MRNLIRKVRNNDVTDSKASSCFSLFKIVERWGMPATKLKSITARVSERLYQAASKVAESRGESMNRLVEQALAKVVREEEDRALFDAFTLLGQDIEGAEVDFALVAQSEVIASA